MGIEEFRAEQQLEIERLKNYRQAWGLGEAALASVQGGKHRQTVEEEAGIYILEDYPPHGDRLTPFVTIESGRELAVCHREFPESLNLEVKIDAERSAIYASMFAKGSRVLKYSDAKKGQLSLAELAERDSEVVKALSKIAKALASPMVAE